MFTFNTKASDNKSVFMPTMVYNGILPINYNSKNEACKCVYVF